MSVQDVYLKIETIPGYSPVEPDDHVSPPVQYRRDCMRGDNHEDGTIPADEVDARRLTAVIYREYLDPGYLIPKPDKLVVADINEPAFTRRVPGTVIYARPGDRLRLHVRNADIMPHSLHVHGLRYGIDSDGSWPFGTQSQDGRRSDEICPGQSWTYTFDVTEGMIGAWPFHDHYRHIAMSVNQGLFGGIVVLPEREHEALPRFPMPPELTRLLREEHGQHRRPLLEATPRMEPLGPHDPGHGHGPDPTLPPELVSYVSLLDELAHVLQLHPVPKPPQLLHVPLFFHTMSGARGTPVFQSTPLNPPGGGMAGGSYTSPPFSFPAVYNYFCGIHGTAMSGVINVQPGGPSLVPVTIVDNQFLPATVTVGVGGQVVWTNNGPSLHSVVERGGESVPSFCLNGRSFVGNTPTILAQTGQRIRWYVFNLDLGMNWHNFHPPRPAVAVRQRDHRRAQHRPGRVVRGRDSRPTGAAAAPRDPAQPGPRASA